MSSAHWMQLVLSNNGVEPVRGGRFGFLEIILTVWGRQNFTIPILVCNTIWAT